MQHGGCYILYGCTTRPCDELVRDNGEGNPSCSFFFFNDTATTEIYTLSLHDALPISLQHGEEPAVHRVEGGLERRTVRPSGERQRLPREAVEMCGVPRPLEGGGIGSDQERFESTGKPIQGARRFHLHQATPPPHAGKR